VEEGSQGGGFNEESFSLTIPEQMRQSQSDLVDLIGRKPRKGGNPGLTFAGEKKTKRNTSNNQI